MSLRQRARSKELKTVPMALSSKLQDSKPIKSKEQEAKKEGERWSILQKELFPVWM